MVQATAPRSQRARPRKRTSVRNLRQHRRLAAEAVNGAIGQAQAERLNIAPELMLRKKTLEALLKSGFPNGPYQLPESLRGWRRELMGQALLDCLATAGEPS